MTAINEGELGKAPAYYGTMLVVCALAVAINVLVIAIVCKLGKFRTSIDFFVTNLAANDIMHAGIILPIHFSNLAINSDEFRGGNTTCKFTMFIPLVTIMAAIYTMVAIAGDRYRVLVLNRSLDRKGALVVLGVIWLWSVAVSAPQLYEYNIYLDVEADNSSHVSCGSEETVDNFEEIYSLIVFIVSYCIPLVCMVGCYSRIASYLYKHSKRFRPAVQQAGSNGPTTTTTTTNAAITDRNLRVLKTFFAITVVFLVLWTPYFLLFVMQEVTGKDDSEEFASWPHLVSRTMSVISTVSNAVLYLVCSAQIRAAICQFFTCGGCRQQGNSDMEISRSKPVASNSVLPILDRTRTYKC